MGSTYVLNFFYNINFTILLLLYRYCIISTFTSLQYLQKDVITFYFIEADIEWYKI